MSAFDRVFAIVVAAEGGFSNDPKDPGNWTGLGCTGECRDYWDRIKGDQLPAPVALLMFDAAVNNGVGKAIVWLQAAVGTAQDGILGPVTLAAVTDDKFPCEVCVEFQAQRMNYMGGLPMWKTYGLGVGSNGSSTNGSAGFLPGVGGGGGGCGGGGTTVLTGGNALWGSGGGGGGGGGNISATPTAINSATGGAAIPVTTVTASGANGAGAQLSAFGAGCGGGGGVGGFGGFGGGGGGGGGGSIGAFAGGNGGVGGDGYAVFIWR